MFGPSEAEVLEVLNHTYWKTALEIREELRKKKGISPDATFRDISIGIIYIRLAELLERDLVEGRQRTEISAEQLIRRGGNYPSEFKLTNDGIRRKNELQDKQRRVLPSQRPQEA